MAPYDVASSIPQTLAPGCGVRPIQDMLSQRPGEAVQVDPIKTCVEIAYIFLRVKL